MIQIILLSPLVAESLLPPALSSRRRTLTAQFRVKHSFVINRIQNMSNTWDTVFEEGFSSTPVCNNYIIICLLVLQALTCHFVCHVPVFLLF
jgi:hypothetical protein